MRGVQLDPEQTEVRSLLQHAPIAGARVLDVGCGDGRLTRRLARHAGHIVGIDPEGDQIAVARHRVPTTLRHKVRYEIGRAEQLPFRARAFDVVLFSWSL